MSPRDIVVIGASEHNLQHVNVRIPRATLSVITGISGSGKSSLAFDTIYAEGQRRYVESLSAYARQFLEQLPKPHVEHIEGLSPAISIEQKTTSRNPRSTVGTVTEIYDYLRVLYAGIGRPHCPECGVPLSAQTEAGIVEQLMRLPAATRVIVLAPVIRGRKGEYQKLFEQAVKEGYVRAKVDGQMVEIDPTMKLKKQFKHDISIVMDRIVTGPDARERLAVAVGAAIRKAEGLVSVEIVTGSEGLAPAWEGERLFSTSMACPDHGPQLIELSPRMFSFNSRFGACAACEGIGSRETIDVSRVIPDDNLSLRTGAIAPWRVYLGGKNAEESAQLPIPYSPDEMEKLFEALGADLETPWRDLPEEVREKILRGIGRAVVKLRFTKGKTKFARDVQWQGVLPYFQSKLDTVIKEDYESERLFEYATNVACAECGGARLKRESLAVTVDGRSISQFSGLTIEEAARVANDLALRFEDREALIAEQPMRQITDRLGFLLNVGLGYLTIDRTAGSLSGGEAQRIRLATQIGSQLTGVLYVLDEPSIGLHQRDNERLIDTLKRLRGLGNTVLVVEHDEQTIRSSDYVVDLGPGAGRLGGKVVAAGTPGEIESNPESVTGRFLSGAEVIAVPEQRRTPSPDRMLRLRNCRSHNLRGIDVDFPLGTLIGVTGVSGSGKSTLVMDTLLPALANHLYDTNRATGALDGIDGLDHLDKIVHVDQSPIGRTPRSNPATYTKTFELIRDLFAQLPEAKVRGYTASRFSFNVKGGRCETCGGEGAIKVEMHFLPNVYVECEGCHGARFNRETLEVKYKNRSIADVLAMTVEEAVEVFDAFPLLKRRVEMLNDVGLGYLALGQPATTLSGGEAQRIKLTRELARRNTGRTLYILDEPTTGLHFADVKRLLQVLGRLVDAGSTVVVIEHNLDVIKACDWLIDLGPEGGVGGGQIVATGTPETIAAHPTSHTGRFLRPLLPAAVNLAAPAPVKRSRAGKQK